VTNRHRRSDAGPGIRRQSPCPVELVGGLPRLGAEALWSHADRRASSAFTGGSPDHRTPRSASLAEHERARTRSVHFAPTGIWCSPAPCSSPCRSSSSWFSCRRLRRRRVGRSNDKALRYGRRVFHRAASFARSSIAAAPADALPIVRIFNKVRDDTKKNATVTTTSVRGSKGAPKDASYIRRAAATTAAAQTAEISIRTRRTSAGTYVATASTSIIRM